MSRIGSPLSSTTKDNKIPHTAPEDQLHTPPLSTSLPITAIASATGSNPSLRSAFDQRPFSPLTLDELGIHPPTTPSALLDIVTPVSLAMSEDGVAAPQASVKRSNDSNANTQVQTSREGTSGGGSRDIAAATTQGVDSVLGKGKSRKESDPSASVASPIAYHDPFLASFLQSLGADPLIPDSSSSSNEHNKITDAVGATTQQLPSSSTANAHANSLITGSDPSGAPVSLSGLETHSESSTGKVSSSVDTAAVAPHILDQKYASDFRQLFQAATSAGSYGSSYWSVPQTSSSCTPSSTVQSTSAYTRSTSSSGASVASITRADKTVPPWASFLPFGSDDLLMTSQPLERAQSSVQASSSLTALAKPTTAAQRGFPAQVPAYASQSKTGWPLDLASLSRFSLPQAPPLQPEHRYPISILESDGQYEPDPETDRESEAGQRVDSRTSRSNSFSVTSKPVQPAAASSKRKSTDSNQSDDQPFLTGIPRSASPTRAAQGSTTSTAPSSSSQMRGVPTQSASDTAGSGASPLKIVPLSNVVRSRSWSSASFSSSGSQEVAPWLVGTAEALHAERMARVGSSGTPAGSETPTACISVTKSATSNAPTSTGTTTERSASHDFTRQALLDFIRRTNLAMASNTSSGGSTAQSASTSLAGSSESASGLEASARASSAASSSWSSTVPAELQARLQNWQHQRKRQRLQSESMGQMTKDPAPSQSTSSISGNFGRPSSTPIPSGSEQSEEQIQRSSKRSTTESEQEQKSRKQEHYQRLLLQLHSQMRMKMQLQMQKQKEMQDKMKRRDSIERKDDPRKEVEFRQPSPPSKSSAAFKAAAREGRKTSIGSQEGSAVFEGMIHGDGSPSGSSKVSKAKEDITKKDRSTFTSTAKTGVSIEGPSRPHPIPSQISAQAATSGHHAPDFATASWWLNTQSNQLGMVPSVPAWPPSQPVGATSWQVMSAGQYTHPPASLPSSWQGPIPASWYSGFGTGNSAVQPSLVPPGSSWTSMMNPAQTPSWRSNLSNELILKHPNWLRDTDPPSLTPLSSFPSSFGGSLPAPQYIDTSSFAISSATMSTSNSQVATADGTNQSQTAEKPGSKRPFSPGEEVVFWAVKGEHSVKLVGTVESMTDRSANIVVASNTERSKGTEREDGSNANQSHIDDSSVSVSTSPTPLLTAYH
ncbi:uncharacterized protein UTRI_01073_B [Ustilago trichophora]|uniref:Uncharacterized protein n=1 Tax=Ustilago trichophora TaxID=86804 RepID=A0A5C3DX36_9BASI|nr:uncharacterized protein UTRI_01073_B [Ustilago trichophora]